MCREYCITKGDPGLISWVGISSLKHRSNLPLLAIGGLLSDGNIVLICYSNRLPTELICVKSLLVNYTMETQQYQTA